MLRTSMISLAALALVATAGPATAQSATPAKDSTPRVRVTIDAATAWQSLKQKNDPDTLPALTSGFQEAVGNVEVNARIVDGLDAYVELYLSSKHHPGTVMDREGYLLLTKLPDNINILDLNNTLFKFLSVKAGHFEVDFGNQHLIRSDNGDVQRNPLIGNYVVDPNTVEAGFELIGNLGFLHGVAGLSNGGTTEDFQPGHQYAKHAKVWLAPPGSESPGTSLFDLAYSIYRVNQSNNPTSASGGSFSEMFSGNRSGSRYSAVLGLTDPEAGQIKIGKGQDLKAQQVDADFNLNRLQVTSLYGWVKDGDINGSAPGTPVDQWKYYGGDARLKVTSNFYLAGRYSEAKPDVFRGDSTTNGKVWRVQGGAGFWLTPTVLFKGEYVYQKYENLGAPYDGNPRFHGVVIEGSARF